MPDNPASTVASPNVAEVRDLKRLTAGIIRAQGNRFIKEMMRAIDIPLGINKSDFERNLTAAIDDGTLRIVEVERWLADVEGWGNQHVYLYSLTSSIARDLTEPKLRQAAFDAGFGSKWNANTVLTFPDQPELTSLSYNGTRLQLVWQEASPGWTPTPDRTYTEEDGFDTYEYRAFRMIERRAVTRFEIRKDLGLAALFVADPIQGDDHARSISEAKSVIGQLINLAALERNQLDIAVVSRNMDQRNIPSNDSPDPSVTTQKARLRSGGSYVEFAAAAKDGGYASDAAIRDVRNSIRGQQLSSFRGETGVFVFQPQPQGLTRPLRVQLYGHGNRIRFWAQMDVNEVWNILQQVSLYR